MHKVFSATWRTLLILTFVFSTVFSTVFIPQKTVSAATAGDVITPSGAGFTAINGKDFLYYGGTLNGRPYYLNGTNHAFWWDGSEWVLTSYNDLVSTISGTPPTYTAPPPTNPIYTNPSDTLVPPPDGWVTSNPAYQPVPELSGAGILTVTIEQATGQADPATTSPVNFTAVFSQPVSDFTTGDVSLSGTAGPTTGTVTGSGTTYNIAVSGMTNEGTVIASIEADVATTANGDKNFASTSTDNSVSYDASAPTVTINQSSTQLDPTDTSPILFDVVFSENITGFSDTDVNIVGIAGTETIIVTSTGTGDTYTVEASGMVDGETVTATILANVVQDAVGNNNEASTSTDNSVSYDSTPPTIIFGASTVPANQSTLTTGPTQIIIEFSESVTKTSAQDTANYLLVEAGVNRFFNTKACGAVPPDPGGLIPDDVQIIVNTATYNDVDPFSTTLEVNGGVPLPTGTYRLFICGTTSIENTVGVHLNNGVDSLLNFTVQTAASASALPATGFRHGEVTQLPNQPTAKAYADTAMTLEIPKLGVSMPIVGVPQSSSEWDVTWLGNSAGYLAGSAFPTWAGNTVITGHVWDAYNQPGAFAELKNLKYGDQVQIQAWGQTYIYEVRESKLVTTKNTNTVFQSEKYDWVTLVTCEFYNPFSGEYLFRRTVRAVLVSVQ